MNRQKLKRFYVKPNFGHWSVVDRTTEKRVVGYSKKVDAENTAAGLNRIRTEHNLVKRMEYLTTMKGYGHYCKKDDNG